MTVVKTITTRTVEVTVVAALKEEAVVRWREGGPYVSS